eukprot:14073301-Alexandrium_andersonii.AAC.1
MRSLVCPSWKESRPRLDGPATEGQHRFLPSLPAVATRNLGQRRAHTDQRALGAASACSDLQ